MPLNSKFKGSVYHHCYFLDSQSIGLHIPEKLHKSVPHNHHTGEGMEKMNRRALKWLNIMQRRLK